jgi:hypothetical protein
MTCMQRRERRCWNRGCRVGVHEVKRYMPDFPAVSSSFSSSFLWLEEIPCEAHHSRNLAVADAPQSVHPSGHPMSHSTHVGFSCPPI